ncbi:UPF0547 protein C16orf87 homolog [Saccostrea cucullata]|uniref:UPF0547 protein C16orf87 homolog n=1 Tax=Saccostrea cuccullata TaxID=36930 RepID=UPI002ED3085C
MGRRRKGREVVTKKCTECNKEAPIAVKFCTCGHEYVSKQSQSPTGNDSPQDKVNDAEESKRVTQKPDFFDSEIEEISSKRIKTIHVPTKLNSRKRGRPKGSTSKYVSSSSISKDNKMNDLLDLKRKQLQLEERAVEALEKIARALEGWQQKSH